MTQRGAACPCVASGLRCGRWPLSEPSCLLAPPWKWLQVKAMPQGCGAPFPACLQPPCLPVASHLRAVLRPCFVLNFKTKTKSLLLKNVCAVTIETLCACTWVLEKSLPCVCLAHVVSAESWREVGQRPGPSPRRYWLPRPGEPAGGGRE